jgi:hypothetical protein
MPGLFDLHAHYAVDLFGEGRVDEYRVNPVLFLANGVTSTFPAGEVDPAEARRGRERIAAGEIPGPRIFGSGPYWGTARPGWRHDAMTPDSIRREAAWWALNGARGFKAKGIRPDQLRALIEVAHEHGINVTGHLDSGFRNTVNPRDAILMGIDRVEHFLGGDALPATRPAYASLEALDLDDPATAAAIRRQARLFIEHGTYFDATLTAYGYFADREPAVFEQWVDERVFLTPYARSVVESRLPRPPVEQFRRIYCVKRRVLRLFHEEGATKAPDGVSHPQSSSLVQDPGSREPSATSETEQQFIGRTWIARVLPGRGREQIVSGIADGQVSLRRRPPEQCRLRERRFLTPAETDPPRGARDSDEEESRPLVRSCPSKRAISQSREHDAIEGQPLGAVVGEDLRRVAKEVGFCIASVSGNHLLDLHSPLGQRGRVSVDEPVLRDKDRDPLIHPLPLDDDPSHMIHLLIVRPGEEEDRPLALDVHRPDLRQVMLSLPLIGDEVRRELCHVRRVAVRAK